MKTKTFEQRLAEITTPEGIRELRSDLGLSQAALARVLGYGSKSRIAELEAGTRNPSPAVRRLLVAYLQGYRPKDWPKARAEKIFVGRVEVRYP